MAVYVAPGVYVREIDLSLYVPSLSTTIVGMVGRAAKGPVNVRTYVTNQQQYIETFGQPDPAIGFESYAALQYLRRGRQLWYVRVVGPSAASADYTFTFGDLQPSEIVDSTPDGALLLFGDAIGGSVISTLPITPGSVTFTATIGGTPYDITDDENGVLAGTGPTLAIAGTVNYTTGAWTLTFQLTEEPDDTTDITVVVKDVSPCFVATATSEGEWANVISCQITDGRDADTFKLTIYYDEYPIERWDNLVLDPVSDDYIETRLNDVSDFVTVLVDAGVVSTDLPSNVLTPVLLTGGDSDSGNVGSADIIGLAWDIGLAQPTGLQLFASPNAIDLNLLCAPGWVDAEVINELIQLCETRADCMAVCDSPEGLNPQEVVDWHNGAGTWAGQHAAFNSSYAALYWPWVKIYDSVNRQYVYTPPCGHILAVYAYTDQVGETWFAPAGLNRGRVISGVDIEMDPTQGEMELMYGDGNAVNMIERFPKDGIVVWGQRTLQRKPSALDRVNVRRLLLYLRKVIASATRYLVFEPNDEKTWIQFGQLVVPYLNDVKQRRGLYDFRVKCDETTNTPAVIDRNQMNAQIFLKPVKAAEFIQVDLVITTTGANFDEVVY